MPCIGGTPDVPVAAVSSGSFETAELYAHPLFARSAGLFGAAGVDRVAQLRIAVFGIGGVGSYTVEALARAGVGTLYLIDGDTVQKSNINRQLVAVHSTIGLRKTAVAAARVFDINPCCTVMQCAERILPDGAGRLSFLPFLSKLDFIVDAVDTIALKAALAMESQERNIPLIAAMGCGNKLNAEMFQFADIYDTSVCPLCKHMRYILRRRGVKKLHVLYSTEQPHCRASPPCSVSWVPATAGLLLAGYIIRQAIGR